MHYLPVLVSLIIVKLTVLFALGGPRRVGAFLKDLVTVGEDHWTWSTCSGDLFEDAEIEAIDQGELVLRHRHGVVRLAVAELTAQSLRLLQQTEKWADYATSTSSSEERIMPFVPESFAAKAA